MAAAKRFGKFVCLCVRMSECLAGCGRCGAIRPRSGRSPVGMRGAKPKCLVLGRVIASAEEKAV